MTTHKIENETPATVTRAVRAVLGKAELLDLVVTASTTSHQRPGEAAKWTTEVDMVRSPKKNAMAVEALQAAYPGAFVKASNWADFTIVRVIRPKATVEPVAVEPVAVEPVAVEPAPLVPPRPVEPDLIDEPDDDSYLTIAEIAAARGETYRGRIQDEQFHNGRLWAQLVLVAKHAGITEHPAREVVARQMLAVIMRELHPALTIYAPEDELPEVPPTVLLDVDGYQWEHDDEAGHGNYRMTEGSLGQLDPAEYAGVRPWPVLLDTEGPVVDASPVATTAREA